MGDEAGAMGRYYDPDEAVNHFGWLWDSDEREWQLIYTWLAREADGGCLMRFLTGPDTDGAESCRDDDVMDAEPYRGQPYMPCEPPACEPGDAVLIVARFPDHSLSLALSAGLRDRAQAAFSRLVLDLAAATKPEGGE